MFGKECRRTITGITFFLFTAVMLFAYWSQYVIELGEVIKEPEAGQEEYREYGSVKEDDTNAVMQAAVQNLLIEYQQGYYRSYPFSFYKEVRLNDNKTSEMESLLSKLTGYDRDELLHADFNSEGYDIDENGSVTAEISENEAEFPIVSEQVTYGEFIKLMQQADDLIGGGSSYSESGIERLSRRAMNYEEAQKEYERFKEDGIAPGMARLMCDYLCIFAALLPAFIAVAVWIRDKSAKIRGILYVKKSSSVKIVLVRYGAIVSLCTLLILLIALVTAVAVTQLYAGESVKVMAFFEYAIIWVVPSIMASAAIGAFFTEVTDTPIGILVMLVYWFMDLSSGTPPSINRLRTYTTLIPRHNSVFMAEEFQSMYQGFLTNRAFIAAFSLILVLLTALLFERKRRGRWLRFDKITLRRKKKLTA